MKFFLAALIASLGLVGCASTSSKGTPLQTVSHVDLPRYMGKWYVIANIPNALERNKVGTYDLLVLRPDGTIDNDFYYHAQTLQAPEEKWNGSAWVVNKTTNAEWRVQFLWPFSNPYLIIALDQGYQWSLIGHPSRNFAWVMSRTPQLSDKTYQAILAKAKAQGYDVSRFVKVRQN